MILFKDQPRGVNDKKKKEGRADTDRPDEEEDSKYEHD